MSDVEGVRNLIGTGLVEFAGGIMTAVIALVYLLRISVSMTAWRLWCCLFSALVLNTRVQDHSPDFPRAAENQRRSDGPADGIPWRSARGEGLSRGSARRKSVSARRAAAAGQRAADADGDFADEPFGYHVLMGIVSALIMFLGARQILAGTMTAGTFFSYTRFLAISGRAGFSDCGHWAADHRGFGRAGAHARSAERKSRG